MAVLPKIQWCKTWHGTDEEYPLPSKPFERVAMEF